MTVTSAISADELVEKIIDARKDSGDVIECLLRLAGNDECDFLEFKAGMTLLPTDAAKQRVESLYWNYAHELIAMINSRGGLFVIGVENDSHEVVPLAKNDPDNIIANKGYEAYTRMVIESHLNPKNHKWSKWQGRKKKVAAFQVETNLDPFLDRRRFTYKGETIFAYIVKPAETPLKVEVNEFDPNTGKPTGRKYEILPYRKKGEIGQCEDYKTTEEFENYKKLRTIKSKSLSFLLDAVLNDAASIAPALRFLPPRNDKFVGRECELRELKGFLAQGRFPLVFGEGGTGKTELVCEYAHRNADCYKGGIIHLNMDGESSWESAFEELCQSNPEVRQWVQKTHRHPDDDEYSINDLIVDFLKAGNILVILDNLNTAKNLRDSVLRRELPDVAFREPNKLHILATTRNLDYDFSRGDKIVQPYQIPLLQDHEAVALLHTQVQFDSTPDSYDYKIAKQIVNTLGNHPWCIEITGGYFSQYADELTLTAYLKILKDRGWDDATPEEERLETVRKDAITPEALLEPTLEKISSNENIDEHALDLAKVIALFPLQGVTIDPLKHFWQELFHYPEIDASGRPALRLAIKRLRQCSILSQTEDLGRFRMHQLTRDVLRERCSPDFIASVGRALAADKLCPNSYWIELSKDGALMKQCPWDSLSNYEYGCIVSNNKSYADCIDWSRLDGYNIALILGKFPELADKLDSLERLYIYESSQTFTAFAKLVACQPERFAEKCDFSKLYCKDIAHILSKQPQLHERCKERFKDFAGANWAVLLSAQPQFAGDCNWSAFKLSNWAYLLARQPQFATHPEFTKNHCAKSFTPCQWAILLARQYSTFSVHSDCPFAAIGDDKTATAFLISHKPELSESSHADYSKFDFKFTALNGDNWVQILTSAPQLSSLCTANDGWTKLSGKNWAALLSKQPGLKSECDRANGFSKFDGYDWSTLLGNQPALSTPAAWQIMATEEHDDFFSPLVRLLYNNPLLIQLLLRNDPKLPSIRDALSGLSAAGMRLLLGKLPTLRPFLPELKLNSHEWARLVLSAPSFIGECPVENFDPIELAIIEQNHPELSGKLYTKIAKPELTKTILEDPVKVRKLQNHFRDLDGAKMWRNKRKLISSLNSIIWNYFVNGLHDSAKHFAQAQLKALAKFTEELADTEPIIARNASDTLRDVETSLAPETIITPPTKGAAFHRTLLLTRYAPHKPIPQSHIEHIITLAQSLGLQSAMVEAEVYEQRDNAFVLSAEKDKALVSLALGKIKSELLTGKELVILVNSNLHPWEANPFAIAAKEAGYTTLMLHYQENDACYCPKGPIRDLVNEMHKYEVFLNKRFVTTNKNVGNFCIDVKTGALMESDTPVESFLYDKLITISPTSREAIQPVIGDAILSSMLSVP